MNAIINENLRNIKECQMALIQELSNLDKIEIEIDTLAYLKFKIINIEDTNGYIKELITNIKGYNDELKEEQEGGQYDAI